MSNILEELQHSQIKQEAAKALDSNDTFYLRGGQYFSLLGAIGLGLDVLLQLSNPNAAGAVAFSIWLGFGFWFVQTAEALRYHPTYKNISSGLQAGLIAAGMVVSRKATGKEIAALIKSLLGFALLLIAPFFIVYAIALVVIGMVHSGIMHILLLGVTIIFALISANSALKAHKAVKVIDAERKRLMQ